ncbi:MAG: hypothetical protein NVSMB38_46050 [Ktedonobacteraceae bacterium]
MKETSDPIKTKTDEIMASVQPGPQGVGMAVAFDWGLAVQIIVMPTVSLLLGLPEMFKQFGPVVGTLLSTAVMLDPECVEWSEAGQLLAYCYRGNFAYFLAAYCVAYGRETLQTLVRYSE